MSDTVKHLTSENFEEEIVSSPVAIVDFWADWCGPCKRLAPIFEEAAEALQGEVNFYKVNVDEERELTLSFGIMSIPTMIIFKDGKLSAAVTGLKSKEEIIELVK